MIIFKLLLTIFEAVGEISNIGWRLKLRCDESLLHVIAFSKKLPWFEPIKVITLKTQLHAVNVR